MSKSDERPKVSTITVEVPDGPDRTVKREGANLDDVLRALVWDLKNEVYDWKSVAETARRLGLPQQTLNDFLGPKQSGLRLETLSKVCAAIQMSPVELLQLHERYHPESRGDTPFAADLVYNGFRSVLNLDQAKRLLRLVELARDRELLDKALEFAEELAGDSVSASDASQIIELSRRKR